MNKPSPYMEISDLSVASGIPVSTIKFYIRKGLLPEFVKTGKTKAKYSNKHLKRLKLIKKLQNEEKMPLLKIKDIVTLIDEEPDGLEENKKYVISHRPQIIESAITLFREKGYENTTIADIAGAARIGKGTFYKYFENKKELFITCIKEIIIKEAIHVDVYDDIDIKNEKDIFGILVEHSETLYRINPIWRDMINMLRAAAVYNPEEFSGICNDITRLKIESYRQQIETGIQKGLLRDIDQTILAVMVMGIHEYCYEYFHTNNMDKQQGIKMLEIVLDVVFNGILKK